MRTEGRLSFELICSLKKKSVQFGGASVSEFFHTSFTAYLARGRQLPALPSWSGVISMSVIAGKSVLCCWRSCYDGELDSFLQQTSPSSDRTKSNYLNHLISSSQRPFSRWAQTADRDLIASFRASQQGGRTGGGG